MTEVIILLKPDVFKRRLWGEAMMWLQTTDFEIKHMAIWQQSDPELDHRLILHYLEHEEKDFYPGLMEFMQSGPIGAILGTTMDVRKLRDDIRRFRDIWPGQGGPENLLHCSDSFQSGQREKGIWYGWR
jgi:nucleoside-diphosphate kinase